MNLSDGFALSQMTKDDIDKDFARVSAVRLDGGKHVLPDPFFLNDTA